VEASSGAAPVQDAAVDPCGVSRRATAGVLVAQFSTVHVPPPSAQTFEQPSARVHERVDSQSV
jgi:hypothetical protein